MLTLGLLGLADSEESTTEERLPTVRCRAARASFRKQMMMRPRARGSIGRRGRGDGASMQRWYNCFVSFLMMMRDFRCSLPAWYGEAMGSYLFPCV